VIVEAAWAYQHKTLDQRLAAKRQQGLDQETRDIAWKAQWRLCTRYKKTGRFDALNGCKVHPVLHDRRLPLNRAPRRAGFGAHGNGPYESQQFAADGGDSLQFVLPRA
jgi:hypothetical protein